VPLREDIAAVLGTPHRLEQAIDGCIASDDLVRSGLSGMFDAPSTVVFDPATSMLSIDLPGLGGTGDDTALVLAMTCASAWMEAALADPADSRPGGDLRRGMSGCWSGCRPSGSSPEGWVSPTS